MLKRLDTVFYHLSYTDMRTACLLHDDLTVVRIKYTIQDAFGLSVDPRDSRFISEKIM